MSSAFELSFELVLSLVAFMGLGALLDWWLGTSPLFMIVGVVVGVVANFVRTWYLYKAAMAAEEAKRPYTRTPPVAR